MHLQSALHLNFVVLDMQKQVHRSVIRGQIDFTINPGVTHPKTFGCDALAKCVAPEFCCVGHARAGASLRNSWSIDFTINPGATHPKTFGYEALLKCLAPALDFGAFASPKIQCLDFGVAQHPVERLEGVDVWLIAYWLRSRIEET